MKTAGLLLVAAVGMAAAQNTTVSLRGYADIAVPVPQAQDKATWYTVDTDGGQSPQNAVDLGGKVQLTVKPYQEAVRVTSLAAYKGGKFSVLVKSGAVTPGIITSIYLASGGGRRSDAATGSQDEIDLEWKGNSPSMVQTNVFLSGQEDLQLVDAGGDSSSGEHLYGVEWDDTKVSFLVNGAVVRTKALSRPLAPMKLQLALWTTIGGWPGLIQWAGGPPDWNGRGGAPVSATFQVLEFPEAA